MSSPRFCYFLKSRPVRQDRDVAFCKELLRQGADGSKLLIRPLRDSLSPRRSLEQSKGFTPATEKYIKKHKRYEEKILFFLKNMI